MKTNLRFYQFLPEQATSNKSPKGTVGFPENNSSIKMNVTDSVLSVCFN